MCPGGVQPLAHVCVGHHPSSFDLISPAILQPRSLSVPGTANSPSNISRRERRRDAAEGARSLLSQFPGRVMRRVSPLSSSSPQGRVGGSRLPRPSHRRAAAAGWQQPPAGEARPAENGAGGPAPHRLPPPEPRPAGASLLSGMHVLGSRRGGERRSRQGGGKCWH